MQTIPLTATPSQELTVNLAQQNCGISVYQKGENLYLDLYISGSSVVMAQLCRDRVYLIRQAYFGFKGDLTFIDSQGEGDPQYSGLGTRWQLVYIEEGQ